MDLLCRHESSTRQRVRIGVAMRQGSKWVGIGSRSHPLQGIDNSGVRKVHGKLLHAAHQEARQKCKKGRLLVRCESIVSMIAHMRLCGARGGAFGTWAA
jgi:hypothetical protein